MTNEEIRSKLMQQADLVAETEEIEVFLGELEEMIKAQSGQHDEILKLFERSNLLRKMYLESIRQDAMTKATHKEPSPMNDSHREYLSFIDGGINRVGGLSPDSKELESFMVPQLSRTYDTTAEDQLKQTDKSIADVLSKYDGDLPELLKEFVELQRRLRKLDFRIHRNIVYIETVLVANGRTAERVVAQERLALELSKNKLIDMADEDDRLMHALSESFKSRTQETIDRIRAENSHLFDGLEDKNIDIKECNLMLSTALSRLNSLRALKGFIKKKNYLLELKSLEEERDLIRKEKNEVDNKIIRNSLMGGHDKHSNLSSRRPSQRSLVAKSVNPSFAVNVFSNMHTKKNSESGKDSKEAFLTFGSSLKNLRSTKPNEPLNSQTGLRDNVRMDSLDQLTSDQNEGHNYKGSSCPATSKNLTKIVFSLNTDSLHQIKESQHFFEDNPQDNQMLGQKIPQGDRKVAVDGVKKSVLGSAKQTSRLFEMREELRRRQAQSIDKGSLKQKPVFSSSKMTPHVGTAKSRIGSREKEARTSYLSLAFGKQLNTDGSSKVGESARDKPKETVNAYAPPELTRDNQRDPDTARTVVKTKMSRKVSQKAKVKTKLKQEMNEVKKRIENIRLGTNIQTPLHQVSKENTARKEDVPKNLASKVPTHHIANSKGLLKHKGTPVKLNAKDSVKSPSGSGAKFKSAENSKPVDLNTKRFHLSAKLELHKQDNVRASQSKNGSKLGFSVSSQPAIEQIEMTYQNGWFEIVVNPVLLVFEESRSQQEVPAAHYDSRQLILQI